MSIKLGQTGVVFPDGSSQTDRYSDVENKGELIAINSYQSSAYWTMPTGTRKIRVQLCGGGGGACGHSESGGAGGYAEKWIDTSSWAAGTTVYCTVGGGGDGRNYFQSCGDGGTSSFGGYLSASGGYGANRNWGHSGGHGGVGSGGDINLWGGGGCGHTGEGEGGGGFSYFGGSGASGHHHYRPEYAEAHQSRGSGGSGTWSSHGRGAYGMGGIVIVYSYK